MVVPQYSELFTTSDLPSPVVNYLRRGRHFYDQFCNGVLDVCPRRKKGKQATKGKDCDQRMVRESCCYHLKAVMRQVWSFAPNGTPYRQGILIPVMTFLEESPSHMLGNNPRYSQPPADVISEAPGQ